MKTHLLTALCATALVAPAWAAQSQVNATLRPTSIGLDDAAQLSVTIQGQPRGEPKIPHVDGLEFTPAGQSSSMQSINGVVTMNVSLIYQVTATRAGQFTIPAIDVPGVGQSQPLTLRVEPGRGGSTTRPRRQAAPQLPAPTIPGIDDSNVDARGKAAFLHVALPKQELYVGEMVPVQVKAYFRAGVAASLNGLPQLSSDAFTLNPLGDKPGQTREIIEGHPYTVVTWTSSLSAVKAGDYALNMDLPVMVRVQERGRRAGGGNPFGSAFGSLFDDDFFDNFFGSVSEKPMTLHTDGTPLKILALPTEGRPAAFSGAVGQFELAGEPAPSETNVGDPITLRWKITGKGNFDRVNSNGLAQSSDWKTYKPSARFEAADSANWEGTKTFEQSVIPTNAGVKEVPAIRFSYFDPVTRSYVTRSTEPAPISVHASSATPAQPAAAAQDTTPAAPSASTPQPAPDGPLPDTVESGRATSSLRPVVLAAWFLGLNATLVAIVAVAFFLRRRDDRLAGNPELLRARGASLAVRESLAAMDRALEKENVEGFFAAARRAVQAHLARHWNVPANSVNASLIHQRLNGEGGNLHALFEVADKVAYSGQRLSASDLQRWRQLVTQELNRCDRV